MVTKESKYCSPALEGLPHQGLEYLTAEARACLPATVTDNLKDNAVLEDSMKMDDDGAY